MKIDITGMTLFQVLNAIKTNYPEYKESLDVNVLVSTDWDVVECIHRQYITLTLPEWYFKIVKHD